MPQTITLQSFATGEFLDRALRALRRGSGLGDAQAQRWRDAAAEGQCYLERGPIAFDTASPRLMWVVAGWASEVRVLSDTRRQIFSFMMPGDVLMVRPAHQHALCTQLALTRVALVDVNEVLQRLPETDRPPLWRAIRQAERANQERRYDHILRLGQFRADVRVVDLLLELRDRLNVLGLVEQDRFRLPLTQEQMGDALGLSVVHMNRTLRDLKAQKLLEMKLGSVTLLDPERLAELTGRPPP